MKQFILLLIFTLGLFSCKPEAKRILPTYILIPRTTQLANSNVVTFPLKVKVTGLVDATLTLTDSESNKTFSVLQPAIGEITQEITSLSANTKYNLSITRPVSHISCTSTELSGTITKETTINISCTHVCTLDYSNIAKIENATFFQEELQKQMAKASSGTESLTAVGTYANITDKSYGGILAKNGVIYEASFNATNTGLIQKFTISNETVSTISIAPPSNVPLNAFHGGILAPSGNIYFVPNGFGTMQIFSPSSETFVASITLGTGHVGGVYSPNTDRMYVPKGAGGFPIQKIDPNTNTFMSLGSPANPYYGCTLAMNGMIYCANLTTCTATCDVLKINPTNDTFSTISLPSPTGSFIGTVLSPSGHIYLVPYTSTKIYTINPNDDSVATVITGLAGGIKWAGGALAPNGKIYLTSEEAAMIGIIDTRNNTIDTTTLTGINSSNFGTASQFFAGSGKIGSNGKIYLTARKANKAASIDTKSNGSYCESIRLSPYFNKF
ncbi:MAG: hypothetical protein SFU98_13445 [Leptospiraceae bacterium]|nr:hypothetical protein [Leptospiraceae bacterium]